MDSYKAIIIIVFLILVLILSVIMITLTGLSMEKGASNIHTSTKARGGNNIDELRYKLFVANQGIIKTKSDIQSSKQEINDIITKNTKKTENPETLENYSRWYKDALGRYNTNRGDSNYIKSIFPLFELDNEPSVDKINHLFELIKGLTTIDSRIQEEIKDLEEKETKSKDNLEEKETKSKDNLEDLRKKAEKIQESIDNIDKVKRFIELFRKKYKKIKELEKSIVENEERLKDYLATQKNINDEINKVMQALAEEQSEIDRSHESKIREIKEFLQETVPTKLKFLEDFSEIDELCQSIQPIINEYYTSLELPKLALKNLIIEETRSSLEEKLNGYINPIRDSIHSSNEENYGDEEKVKRGLDIKNTMRDIKNKLLKKYDDLQNLLKNAESVRQDIESRKSIYNEEKPNDEEIAKRLQDEDIIESARIANQEAADAILAKKLEKEELARTIAAKNSAEMAATMAAQDAENEKIWNAGIQYYADEAKQQANRWPGFNY